MEFEHSDKVRKLQERVEAFMAEHIYPNEEELFAEVNEGDRWQPVPLLESLKARARATELWNLFLPESQYGAGLTNLEYAPLCEIMGRSPWAPEVFNCSAPDTGNMEVLVRYGTVEQRERWLDPLLAGEIRSAFAMTEPDVASSDATNIETRIRRDANDYVINGRKWVDLGGARSALQDHDRDGPVGSRQPGPSPAAVDDIGGHCGSSVCFNSPLLRPTA
jgi:acyl-CoA dehydrogenase